MIRDDIKAATITAMKGGDKETTATLRLVQSEIKNRDIEARTGGAPADDDQLVTEVLQKMVKKRRESADMFRKGNRPELAEKEEAELKMIESYMPSAPTEAEIDAAIAAALGETPGASLKQMGVVMKAAQGKLAGKRVDGKALSDRVRAKLS